MELEQGQCLPELSSRVLDTDEPIIAVMRAVVAEASSSASDGPAVASLAQGAVWWHPPAIALAAAAAAAAPEGGAAERSSGYGDDMGLPELRAALLRKCERDHGLRAEEHAAMVSAGANLAVSALALALLDSSSSCSSSASSLLPSSDGAKKSRTRRTRKDAAVLFPPYYFNAKMAVQLAGAEVVFGESDAQTWLPDVEWLERRLAAEDDEEAREEKEAAAAGDGGDDDNLPPRPLLPRIRMVYLVNPGNPSGVVVPLELVQRLVEICSGKERRSRRAVFLVLDSTYEAFAPPSSVSSSPSSPSPSLSCPSQPPFPLPSAPHVLHVGSFSKAYGAAGWRVGYVIYPIFRGGAKTPQSENNDDGGGDASAPPAAVVDLLGPQLLKIQDTLPIHAAIASQRLALACLEGEAEREGAREGSDTASPPPVPSSFGRGWVAEKVTGLAASRRAAEAALANLGAGSRVWGEGAIYLWARLPPPPRTTATTTAAAATTEGGGGERGKEPAVAADDREFVRFCVSRHRVAVIPGSACGVPGCVRVAYGKPRPGPEFEEAAGRLARACSAWVARGSE